MDPTTGTFKEAASRTLTRTKCPPPLEAAHSASTTSHQTQSIFLAGVGELSTVVLTTELSFGIISTFGTHTLSPALATLDPTLAAINHTLAALNPTLATLDPTLATLNPTLDPAPGLSVCTLAFNMSAPTTLDPTSATLNLDSAALDIASATLDTAAVTPAASLGT